jgi:hypothetical protein
MNSSEITAYCNYARKMRESKGGHVGSTWFHLRSVAISYSFSKRSANIYLNEISFLTTARVIENITN